MTDTPDPKTVRECAQQAMAEMAFRYDAVGSVLDARGLSYDEYGAAVVAHIDAATVQVSWPDEQPQDDGDVRAVAAFLQWFRGDPDDYVIESIGDQLLTVGTLRRMVAALEARDTKGGATR